MFNIFQELLFLLGAIFCYLYFVKTFFFLSLIEVLLALLSM